MLAKSGMSIPDFFIAKKIFAKIFIAARPSFGKCHPPWVPRCPLSALRVGGSVDNIPLISCQNCNGPQAPLIGRLCHFRFGTVASVVYASSKINFAACPRLPPVICPGIKPGYPHFLQFPGRIVAHCDAPLCMAQMRPGNFFDLGLLRVL